MTIETMRFLDSEQAREIAAEFGTPIYVYSQEKLEEAAKQVLDFPNAFGLTARYAMKSSPNQNILRLFEKMGLHFDASSGYEVKRAIAAGIPAEKILLTCQEVPAFLPELIKKGILFNASSLEQIRFFGKYFPGKNLGLRLNPGLGSGGTNRTNVGGPGSSFGIWKEHVLEAKALADSFSLVVNRLHTHIGSGSDPEVWLRVADMSLEWVKTFPAVTSLDLGGGFKVGRMAHEISTDLQKVGQPVKKAFERFAEETARKLKLEIEPGTFLVANSASLLTHIQDITDTGNEGYRFIKLNAGMTEILRPSLYGAQHPMVVVPQKENDSLETETYIVAGHCCESGDILSPAPGDAESLSPRLLAKAQVGDLLVVEGAGAYCSGMSAKHYNSFPEAAEVLIRRNKKAVLIRKRENEKDLYRNEKRVI
jgi:diaminopimelate decarboxylase